MLEDAAHHLATASAAKQAGAGDALLAPSVTRRLIAHFADQARTSARTPPGLAELTEREREVLSLVVQGLSNAELAGSPLGWRGAAPAVRATCCSAGAECSVYRRCPPGR